mmetsp:Transcript_15459/g.27402  ORF Transcript_15459/g.27402 Transcript_15459/m.27402 type:complete len:107 (+) Transcript_15459:1206-1526(+)
MPNESLMKIQHVGSAVPIKQPLMHPTCISAAPNCKQATGSMGDHDSPSRLPQVNRRNLQSDSLDKQKPPTTLLSCPVNIKALQDYGLHTQHLLDPKPTSPIWVPNS